MTSKNISRRTVVAGAAWAVPAVALAAAPVASAAIDNGLSNGVITPVNSTPCKLPGNSQELTKAYRYRWRAENPIGGTGTDTFAWIKSVQIFVGGSLQNTTDTQQILVCTNVGNCTEPCGLCSFPSAQTICLKENAGPVDFDVYAGPYPTSNGTTYMELTYDVYTCASPGCLLERQDIKVTSGSYLIGGPVQGSCEVPAILPCVLR